MQKKCKYRRVACALLLGALSPLLSMGSTDHNAAASGILNVLQNPWNNVRPYLQEKLAFFPGLLSFTRSHYKTIAALALVAGVSVYAWKKWHDTRPRPQPQPDAPSQEIILAQSPPVAFPQVLPQPTHLPVLPVQPAGQPEGPVALASSPAVIVPAVGSASLVTPPVSLQISPQSLAVPKRIEEQLRKNFVQLIQECMEHISKSITQEDVPKNEINIIIETWNKVVLNLGLNIIKRDVVNTDLLKGMYHNMQQMATIANIKDIAQVIYKISDFLYTCMQNTTTLKSQFATILTRFNEECKNKILPLIKQLSSVKTTATFIPVLPPTQVRKPHAIPLPISREEQLIKNYKQLLHNFFIRMRAIKLSKPEAALLWQQWCQMNMLEYGDMCNQSPDNVMQTIEKDIFDTSGLLHMEPKMISRVINALEQFLRTCITVFDSYPAIKRGLQKLATWLNRAVKKDIQSFLAQNTRVQSWPL